MKKVFYFLIVVSITSSCKTNTIDIPDVNFRNALLNSNCIDTNGDGKADSNVDINNDGQIQLSEIENLEFLDVSSRDIKSLKGIQYFVNLTKLNCYKNQLTNLDISKNTKLQTLFCYDNQITNLNVSKLSDLINLGCRGNKLIALDVSKNKKLKALYCYKNNLTSLNINNGNNINMTSMWAFDNPELTCIKIDESSINFPICSEVNYSGWCKDSTVSYSNECN